MRNGWEGRIEEEQGREKIEEKRDNGEKEEEE